MKNFVCLIVIIFLTAIQTLMPAAPEDDTHKSVYSVLDFGAKGDGKTDDTDAFQKALDTAAGKDSIGGKVSVPRGIYLIKRHLNIPINVALEGIWEIPTAWSQYKGTTLLVVEGEGNAEGNPFITLWNNSVVNGLAIFYPNQVTSGAPKPYPWTIASGGGDNCSIIDVLIVNPYQAVDFGSKETGRHYIRNLYAQPLYRGLFVDQCYDVGRIENVHFWPFLTCNNPQMESLQDWVIQNGEAFIFGRTDWEYVYNTFCWGYKIGYRFTRTKNGVANGNFLGIGADATQNAVAVDDCAPYGLLITNGEFVSFPGAHPVSVDVSSSNTGVIQFQNCAFWGDPPQIANIKGKGAVTFNACNFQFWGYEKKRLPAIECSGGNLIINACNFQRGGEHVRLNEGTASAVITSNRFAEKPRIVNNCDGDVQVGFNVQSNLKGKKKNINKKISP
ncbi:MAG TPA: glycosyl hydrolase family 28-related protein [Candidatus Sumerlaeota bacterium]|nr:glycosyl hydrolase family 28-related protein [Candidatus Sumerlaeota bacterium]HRR30741.1 glycosyl hydrolase family 28-related protein [Candidatus Sumerlaeia bacterium]HON50475.1 glycosyl hydrolase family 28-related protein [Candidatus Sumerlaeota bacterium]HOR63691.1 glycosyl hydrolase family 28-related protein [Candidatus Sumerlaeota bacterium]HPL73658.1 glycosyl hydrolase family 28-related protein [Candidatus Sumerlaeota bacterium]